MGAGLGAGPFPEGVLVTCLLVLTGVLTTMSATWPSEGASTGDGALGLEEMVLAGTAGAGPFLEGVEEALEVGVLAGLPVTGGEGAGPLEGRRSPGTGGTT